MNSMFAIDDPRPDDMAELARLTAIELRKRGTWARVGGVPNECVCIARPAYCMAFRHYLVTWADFDSLGPIACADVIQAREAQRAQEWAGDK